MSLVQRLLLSLLLALGWSGTAQARRMPLDPQNRPHLGLSWNLAQSLGLMGGLDSRLTRIISVDVGGFLSPIPLPDDIAPDSDDGRDFVFLRHGLYFTPGLRVPHRQGRDLQWDVFARPGFAAIFTQDVHPDNYLSRNERYQTQADPALFGGGELLLGYRAWGLRLGGRAFLFRQFSNLENNDIVLVRPQTYLSVYRTF